MSLYLCTKVSSIILTSFTQGVILPPPPTSKRTPKKPTQIRVKDSNATIFIHHGCRLNFLKSRRTGKPTVPQKKLRSTIGCSFDWKPKCFLCTKNADKKYFTVSRVETLTFVKTLFEHCLKEMKTMQRKCILDFQTAII